MEPTEKELEGRLKHLGIRLASPPSGVDELLRLLDQTEIYLSRVQQSPSTSMSDALSPVMNSLTTNELLNHPEGDVKVFVAACINEITRITAPDAPYSDSLMKDIFTVIVDVFGKLDDISGGPSYSKKISILETVAKVRSCVVMLDLECDDLILQMFKHFLKSIRPDHSINVFSSMETIMSLVLEESENISEELLHCLLSSVHKSKKDVMPVACRLAETVISKCAMKLKPYLLAAVNSTGICLGDYSDKVASICQKCSVAPEQNEVEESKLPQKTVHNELPQESKKPEKSESCFEEFSALADKAIHVLSNGFVPFGNANSIVEPVSSEFKHENSSYSEQCRNNTAPRTEDINLGSINEKPGNELDAKHVESKSSSVQLPDASDSSRVEDDMGASSTTIRRVGQKRKGKSLKSDMALETEVLLEPEREVELRPLEGLVGDNKCVISATASDNLLGKGRKQNTKSLKSDGASDIVPKITGLVEPKREIKFQPLEGQVGDSTCVISASTCKDLHGTRLSKRGKSTKSQLSAKISTPQKTALSSGRKRKFENTPMEKEGSLAIVSEHKADHCAVSNFDKKPSLDSAKKSLEDNATADVSTTVVSGGMSLKEEQKEPVKNVTEGISFRKQWKSNIKQPTFKDAAGGNISAESCLKEMIVSSKASREADNDENHLEKFVDTSSTKKSRRKTSGWKIHAGRKIEVWWPDDAMFYKGVIELFDPVTKMHKIVYDDGDIEFLLLRNERWNYIDSKNLEKGHEDDNVILASSLQVRGRSNAKSKGTPIQQSNDKKPAVKSWFSKWKTSKATPIQQSHDKKPAVKSWFSKWKTSKVATSSNEKTDGAYGGDGTKVDVSPQASYSNEPPNDKTTGKVKSDGKSNGANELPSVSASKSVKRSRHRLPKGEKNPQTVTESAETKDATSQDAGVVKNDVSTPAKLEGKSDGKPAERFSRHSRRKSGKPSVATSSIGTQTDIVLTKDKHKGNDTLKLSSPSAKTIKKKETPAASTYGIIDVKNSASGGAIVDGSVLAFGPVGSQSSAVNPNKRRRNDEQAA
ncbi:hypothetical protein KSP39_PZI023114 [Platanthera zijinensis]|uniref:Uncharacterized protein n=1 Tax=Platanthera zijinensis TaxID=2320716 RepID=A0AAP0AUU4_9ASPA